MATTTPNFGWPVPTSTDLVKDGATAIEALGDGIDTSLVDLKGGLTGQVLSKTTNADMDFTWVTSDDANAIQNSIVNAKGDLIGASADDVPAILSVGANGETLVADSSTSTGLRYTENYAAGKNAIINGAFNVWQRGTSFTQADSYCADRWGITFGGAAPTAAAITQQTFTPGTAPVAGYESQYFLRMVTTTIGSCTAAGFQQLIEDVRTFAGQTITVSFWAKADAARTVTLITRQNFGSGGSTATFVEIGTASVTTSWARYSVTYAVPSVSGKTIGTSSFLAIGFRMTTVANGGTLDLWGMQAEEGSVATAFQTATGTLQGELAACQRYYYRNAAGSANAIIGLGIASSTTLVRMQVAPKVTMRIAPTSIEYAGLYLTDGVNAFTTLSSISNSPAGPNSLAASIIVASGLTQFRSYELDTLNSTDYIAWSAEL